MRNFDLMIMAFISIYISVVVVVVVDLFLGTKEDGWTTGPMRWLG